MSVFQSVIIGLIVIALLILLDLITKLATALNSSNNGFIFDLKKFLLFLRQGVAPYFAIWLGYSLVNILIVWLSDIYVPITIPGFAENIMAGIIYTSASTIAIKVGISILDNLKKLGIRKNDN